MRQVIRGENGKSSRKQQPQKQAKKERVCERCDCKETAVISMISKKKQPTTSTKSDTAVKTGDSTNILLWSMVMVISLAGILTALFFKRRRNR